MRILAVLSLAALGLAVASQSAEAVPISFNTTGTFTSPTGGCTAAAANTITCDGYTLTFSSVPTVQDVPFGFNSVVNFGQIAVTGNSTTLVSGGGTFNLQINQTIPTPTGGSPFSYTALLTATLQNDASMSFLQFNGPFGRTITGSPYDVVYNLTEADDGVAGRSRISGTGEIPLNINGTITPIANAPIPEPASLLLLGSGLLIAGRKLRRKTVTP